MTDKIIRGSGGPPRGQRQPTRAPDTLNSRQFASIQDLLSEGEIEGFATPSKAGLTKGTTAYNNAALKDIFLDDTPILNPTASNTNPQTADFNFQSVGFTPRFGTSNQSHIPGIESSQSTTAVGVTVTNSSPVTRQITNTNVDAVKVTVTFPQLQKLEDNGDILGSEVNLKIQVQYNGGGFTDVLTDTITGRTADAYQKEYRVSFTGAFPVDIRVVRLTADSTSSSLIDAFTWTSLGEIVDDKQTYLNSAYTNLRIDSEQFSSIPKRAFRIRGVKVRIPGAGASSSGTPTVDLQTGRIVYPSGYIFNGTMGAAQWCSCPALILLDLLTTERYGFGTHITDSNLDLFSFVAASKYANELVSDGFGGQEARFSCNVNLQGSMEAYTLINELAGVMRCFPIWSEGSVTITQDKPTDPSYLFSLANVGEGGFSYSGSSLKQRHSVISVSYFNMDSREIDYEVVEDSTAQAKLGIVKKDVKAFACTSRGQAQRLGKAILFSEQNESEVVSFTTSIDAGAIVRPGSVISINDPVRGGERRAGRIKTATTTQITVDNVEGLDTFTGTNKKCSVILPDGTVETKNITGIIDSVITLDSALGQTPNPNTIWLVQSSTLEAQTYRVITVEEQDGINYAITALTYIDGKYANIESGISLPARNISLLNEPKSPPSNLQASERVVVINALAVTKLILSWVSVTGVSQYLVQYRFNNTNWVSTIVFRPDFELTGTQAGAYEFKVYSYNAGLLLSATSSDLTFNAVGKTDPPGNVQNLSMEPITNKLVRLRWTKAVDPDVLHGGRVYVRHSNLTDGSGTFQNSVDLVTALAGNSTDVVVPSLEGEYILKFQDDQENFSVGEASIIQDLPDLIDAQVILQDREDLDSPPFDGDDTNTTFNTTASALQLTNPATNATGEYAFKDILDIGAVFSLDLKRVIRSIGFVIGTDIETIIPSGSFWDGYAIDGNFDGAAADEANCQIQVATSQTASGTFGSFNNFANGTFKGRRFKFKLILETTNVSQNMNVQQAGYTAEFQSRTEQNYQTGGSTSTLPQDSGTSASGLDVTFAKPFFTGISGLGNLNEFKPSVGITIMGAVGGEYFTIKTDTNGDFLNAAGTVITGTGFNISIKDSNDNPVNKKFTFQAVGYGKGV
nr:phage-related protein tail component-like protein [uncultured Mediterranean phage uvMED]